MSDPRSQRSRRWTVIVGILVAGVLLALLVFLHLSGSIGPGIH